MHLSDRGFTQVYKVGVYEVYRDGGGKFHIYEEGIDTPVVMHLNHLRTAQGVADKLYVDHEMSEYRIRHPEEFGG